MSVVSQFQGGIYCYTKQISPQYQTKTHGEGAVLMKGALAKALGALRYFNRVLVGSKFRCNSTYFGQNSWT